VIATTGITNRKLHLSALTMAVMVLPFSIRICHWALIAYVILWCAEGNWNHKFLTFRKGLLLHLLFFLFVLFLAGMIYTENEADGWLSLDKKIFFFAIPLAMATSTIRFTQNEIRFILYSFVTTCLIASLICLINSFFLLNRSAGEILPSAISYLSTSDFKSINPDTSNQWLFFSYMGLADGIGMHPAYFSLYLAFCIVFLLSEFYTVTESQKTIRTAALVFIIYFSAFIIFLASRIIIFSLLLIYLVMITSTLATKTKRKAAVGPVLLVLLCLSMLYVNPVSRYKNWQELWRTTFVSRENTTGHTSTQIRVSLLWMGWKTFARVNPLTGAGTGDVNAMMRKTSEDHSVSNIHNTYNPHNQYIAIAIGLGLIGLVIFIACLAIPFMMAFTQRDYLLMGFLFLFAALCFSETVLERQKGVVLFALFYPLLSFHRQAFHTFLFPLKISDARN
jgi:O-antigen ligase